METYTIGTTPLRVLLDALPHKYAMELNRSDMLTVLHALLEVDDTRALDLRLSILETLGIEEV